MSSQTSASLLIECWPSRRLLLLYGCLFGAAVLGAVVPDIPFALKVGCCAMLGYGAVTVLRCHVLLLGPDCVVALGCNMAQWTLYTRDGGSRPARLLAAAFWMFDVMPLVFADGDGKRFTVLLAPDSARAGSLRELRAWIRHRLPAA